MKGTDRLILLALPLLALAIGFWMLVLAPKGKEAGELQDRITSLRATVDASEAEIAISEQARSAFPQNYADLISLGAAVPEQDQQSTLIQDFTELAKRDSVNLRSFKVVPGTGAAAAAVAPPPITAPAQPTATAAPGETTTVGAPATEAGAAALPLGATVGPAGLPVTPYQLQYFGGFFDMAGLFADLDASVEVHADATQPEIHGRLLTVDGFVLKEDPVSGFPAVSADVNVTTYLVPAEQGISAGATPAGPAPIGSPDAPTTIATTGTAPAGTTAAVAP